MLDEDKLIYAEIQVKNPRIYRHIKRGWIGGVSVGSDGFYTFMTNYPWWYKVWIWIKRTLTPRRRVKY